MTDYYVDASGAQQGGFGEGAFPPSGEFPADWVVVASAPEYGDQAWDFKTKTWGASRMQAVMSENSWRTSEISEVHDQLLLLEIDDPSALPGSASDWSKYLARVKLWKETNANFPDSTKRPVRP